MVPLVGVGGPPSWVKGPGAGWVPAPPPPPCREVPPGGDTHTRPPMGAQGDFSLFAQFPLFPPFFSPSSPARQPHPGGTTGAEPSQRLLRGGPTPMDPPTRACSCGSPASSPGDHSSDSEVEANGPPPTPPKTERSRKRPGGPERAPPELSSSPRGGKRPRKGDGGDAPPSDGDRLFAQKVSFWQQNKGAPPNLGGGSAWSPKNASLPQMRGSRQGWRGGTWHPLVGLNPARPPSSSSSL